jgi:hypothetical protein
MVEVMLGVFFGHLLFSVVVGVVRTIFSAPRIKQNNGE